MPVVRGAGSISSPIIISDDEDEAVVESQLNATDSDSSLILAKADDLKEATGQNVEVFATCSTTPDVHTSSSAVQTIGYSMALRMGFRPGRGLGLQFDGKQFYRRLLSLTGKPSRTSRAVIFWGTQA
jgi:hypothetical protein